MSSTSRVQPGTTSWMSCAKHVFVAAISLLIGFLSSMFFSASSATPIPTVSCEHCLDGSLLLVLWKHASTTILSMVLTIAMVVLSMKHWMSHDSGRDRARQETRERLQRSQGVQTTAQRQPAEANTDDANLYPQLDLDNCHLPRLAAIQTVENLHTAKITSGKHDGKSFGWIFQHDQQYINWLRSHKSSCTTTGMHMLVTYSELRTLL